MDELERIINVFITEGHAIARFAFIGNLIGKSIAVILLCVPCWLSALIAFVCVISWPSIQIFIENYVLIQIGNPTLFLD